MAKKLFLSILVFTALQITDAQIFTWKNPNLQDSLKKDSILAAKIEKDVFTRDTLDFIRTQNRVIVDEGVLVKNTRSQILGDLNSKGSIIRGLTFGHNLGQSVHSSMDKIKEMLHSKGIADTDKDQILKEIEALKAKVDKLS